MDTLEKAGGNTDSIRPGIPSLRGIHHLALVTDDMKATCDFYVRVMGMPLVHALTTGGPDPNDGGSGLKHTEVKGIPPFPHIPHVFFDMGGDSLLAFFELIESVKQNDDDLRRELATFCKDPKWIEEMISQKGK